MRPRAGKGQRGQATVEWCVVTLAMVFALFVEIPGYNQSAMAIMGAALRGLYRHVALLLSLP